ncbi:MAG: hypothetical protein IT249_11825 [Chitinophagaceae bacterium]|nr:hypothetical protein [Chitinophagaceae bacterium]
MGGTLANGTDTTEAFPIAQDAYGFSLHYFKNDYKAIGYTPQGTSVLGALSTNAAPLFNGNIAAMAVNIPKLGDEKVYNYHYDQLNRIVAMDVYNGLNVNNGTFTPISVNDYKERVSYDPNGNILTYTRNGDAARLSMDDLSYSYTANTNRLHKVIDAAADAAPGDYSKYGDIKQGQADDNYQYDDIGNLVTDNAESITNVTWNVYGKISSITKSGSLIKYVYDAAGNRIMKQTTAETTVYVRDASSNVMSVYNKPASGALVQSETHIYGSSRIGMATLRTTSDASETLSGGFEDGIKRIFTRGEKLFELSNHLGNVLAVVSDKRISVSLSGSIVDYYNTDVKSSNDYYSGGMPSPDRTYTSGGSYQFGFGGKRKENEMYGEANAYDFDARTYNTRLVRWFNVDPKVSKYPDHSPYSYSGNNPIAFVDKDGEDWIVATSTDKKTGVTTITITINAKVANNSSKPIDMEKLIKNIEANVEKLYSGTDASEKLVWKTNLNLQEFKVDKNNQSNLKTTDHFLEILDGDHFDGKTTAGFAQKGGLYVALNADYFNKEGTIGKIDQGSGIVYNTSIVAHELGHTGGLIHPWEFDENPNLNSVNGKTLEIPGQITEDSRNANLFLTFMGYSSKPPAGVVMDAEIPAKRPNPATVGQIKDIKLNADKGNLNGNNTISSTGKVLQKRRQKDFKQKHE